MVSKVTLHRSGREIAEGGKIDIEAFNGLSVADKKAMGFGVAMNAGLTGGAGLQKFEADFFRTMLPGVLRQAIRESKIDKLVGRSTVGNWHDKEIALRTEAPVGRAELYGDDTNTPLASYEADIESRGVVRFESGFKVGQLELARQAAAGYSDEESKRRSMTLALRMSSDDVGFYGFNSTDTRVFGFLNDPNLPNYVANGANPAWVTAGAISATFENMQADLTQMVSGLDAQSGGRFSDEDSMTLALPAGYRIVMGVTSTTFNTGTFGEWIKATYPNIRIEYVEELKDAVSSGTNGAYLYLENADSGETDFNSATFMHMIPTDFTSLGRREDLKGFVEAATNATAGVLVAYPWAVYRMSGI